MRQGGALQIGADLLNDGVPAVGLGRGHGASQLRVGGCQEGVEPPRVEQSVLAQSEILTRAGPDLSLLRSAPIWSLSQTMASRATVRSRGCSRGVSVHSQDALLYDLGRVVDHVCGALNRLAGFLLVCEVISAGRII